jgi:hypothetical protein
MLQWHTSEPSTMLALHPVGGRDQPTTPVAGLITGLSVSMSLNPSLTQVTITVGHGNHMNRENNYILPHTDTTVISLPLSPHHPFRKIQAHTLLAANISSLPPELKHLIVSDLDPVTSACLGLASKDYYPIHRSHHKKRISLFDQAEGRVPLALYLRDWAPKDMILDPRSGRLVRREREPDGERARWERRLRRSKRYERMDVGRYRW